MNRFSKALAVVLLSGALAMGCGGGGGGQPTGGIHAKLGYSEGGGLRVVQVPPGGAADLAGLRVNDVIIAINGTSVRELDYESIVERLRGPAGSSVQLDVFRDGEVNTVVVMRQAYTR
ncbi:MAG: PDZ domain-containing protein [Myxococcales bacterium]|jgi:carboxyl-terminal processing protease|nr:MAG: PDZ domain-containing protein [Myxococcales bacterium]